MQLHDIRTVVLHHYDICIQLIAYSNVLIMFPIHISNQMLTLQPHYIPQPVTYNVV